MHLHGIADWQEMIRRANQDPEWFWTTFSKFAGVKWHKSYSTLLDQSGGFAWAKWFVGGQLNIAFNCLDWQLRKGEQAGVRVSVGAEHLAIIWENEDGSRRSLTYGELDDLSGRVAGLLAKLGVQSGDAVGIYMPMVPEVVAVFFGCLKLGAVAVPIFSGFGARALAARLADCQAKVLFTADGGKRHGKMIEIKKDADEVKSELPHLKKMIVLRHCQNSVSWDKATDVWFDEAVADVTPLATREDLEAEHPSMYLYTSGTTGKPKATVHTHAGALFQIAKETGLSFDIKPQDVFFWLTDIGWMMGPWEMIGCTYWGATMVIFEGAPNYPSCDRLWQIVEANKVNTLGISPTAIRVLKVAENQGIQKYDLSSLRLLGSTGEPWDYDSYMWFFEKVGGGRCPVINVSGGTEVVGCLLMPLPVMPLKACSLGGPGLAMDVDVFDESGKSVTDSIGYLVCKKPAPSMTKGFLNDRERYLDTYFSRFPGVWYHGDWAKVDADGAWFLFGRSDDTIKVAGKRVGPAEVEAALMEHPAVAEAAVIGAPDEVKGEAIICFVALAPGSAKSDDLMREIEKTVVKQLGAVFRPQRINFVGALPKTRSGKIVRGAIKRKYLGEPLGDISSIENPLALESIGSL
jgi:acetyl-CoA synthetase